ncbi:MAG: hypothetical protein M1334_04855 [Patescibacteria group bacterium]|nr:hypothetical protein [Patescibacteria group bacterium]
MKKSIPIAAALILFLASNGVFAADGSGINTVSPNSVVSSATGNTFNFTFTAAETMDSGGIEIAVPSSWTAAGGSFPGGASGVPGYTTATASGGMVADVINNANSLTNWQKGNGCGSIALSNTIFHEGGASVECVNLAQRNNKQLQYYRLSSAVNWSAYTKIGFWIYSSLSVKSGDLAFAVSSANNLMTPQLAAINTALGANTWTYIVLDISALTRSSILSYGLWQSVADTAINHANIYVDDILAGPGSATFPGGGVINARILQLANAQTVTVAYGSGGGVSGVMAPGTLGVYTFTTQSRVSDSGNLTNIASSPTITVGNPTPTLISISPTSTTSGSSGFAMTVNGTNFIASSTVNFNGSPRATTYISSTQLTASILVSDLTTGGTFPITVTNPSPSGGTSTAQTFTVVAANNPVPVLTGISPTSTLAGSGGFTLTLNGSNFISSSTVYFNGSSRSTTFSSSTQLTAQILSSDVASIGSFPITVANPAPGGGTSTAQTFVVSSVNPAPTLTSISPTSTFIGSSGFTLTINGSNFLSSSTVKFNGSNRVMTFINANQIEAAILTSDLTATGTFPVTVTSPSPGGGTSAAQTFTVSAAQSSQPPPSTVTPLALNGAAPISSAVFEGQAYPGSKVSALRRFPSSPEYEGSSVLYSVVNSDGTFKASLYYFPQADYLFALQATDKNGTKSRIVAFS